MRCVNALQQIIYSLSFSLLCDKFKITTFYGFKIDVKKICVNDHEVLTELEKALSMSLPIEKPESYSLPELVNSFLDSFEVATECATCTSTPITQVSVLEFVE